MALTKLTDYERDICKEVVLKRYDTVLEYHKNSGQPRSKRKHDSINLCESILDKLERNFVNFTSMEKAFISGCLNEHIIDKSEEIRSTKEFDFLLEHDRSDWKNKFIRYDTAAALRNRIGLSTSDHKHRLIKPIQYKIESILDSDKILYSTSGDKIYKVAIYNSDLIKYWKIETDSEGYFDRIKFVDIHPSYVKLYSGEGTPSEVYDILLNYEKNNELRWGQINLKQLLEKMLESNLELA